MGSDLGVEYWEKRYLNNDFGWDIGAISTPLRTYFDGLSNKNSSILIPGAGNAYEAEYLFNQGFEHVYICDLALTPLQNFSVRCPNFPQDHLLHIDFFILQGIKFDLIVEQTFFCALNPSLRQKYFEKVTELLNPGGHLIGLLFDDRLNADHPPFGGDKNEYLTYVHPPLKIKTFETCYNSIKPRQGRELFINLEKNSY